MKKKSVIALLSVLIVCFGLCACGGSDSGMDKDTEYIIESFFAQENYDERMTYLEENYSNYPKLTTEEIEAIIEGEWMAMKVESFTMEDWWTYDYADGVRTQSYRYLIDGDKYDRKLVKGYPHKYVVQDDMLYEEPSIVDPDFSQWDGYEFYKMHDNFYYVRQVQNDGGTYSSNYNYIYTQMDSEKLVYDNPSWEKYDVYNNFK